MAGLAVSVFHNVVGDPEVGAVVEDMQDWMRQLVLEWVGLSP